MAYFAGAGKKTTAADRRRSEARITESSSPCKDWKARLGVELDEDETHAHVRQRFEEKIESGAWTPMALVDMARFTFSDARRMSTFACILRSIVLDPDMLEYWLPTIKPFGDLGEYGLVFGAYMRGTKISDGPVAVLKTAKHSADEPLTLHEAAVGVVLNGLRSVSPAFAQIYTVLRCRRPSTVRGLRDCTALHDKTREGGRGRKTAFVVYEPILPNVSMSRYVKTCTFDQYLGMLAQVIDALRIAFDRHSFCHYDLHTENVLVRRAWSPSTGLERKRVFVKVRDGRTGVMSEGYATIIDYGMSYIFHDGRHLGHAGMAADAIFSDRPFPLVDAWKFFYWSLTDMATNPSCLQQVLEILPFFTDDAWPNVIGPFDIKYNPRTASYSHDKFLRYLESRYPHVFVPEPRGK